MGKAPPPPLMPILRSRAQAEIFTRVLLSDAGTTLSELARSLALPFSTVQREANRLEEAGILRTQRLGQARMVRANADHPAARPLRELVMIAFGPRQVVLEEFRSLSGLDCLYSYGSWAARYQGQPGPCPHGIDVLAVGNVDRDDAFDAADRAQRRLGQVVQVTVVSTARWDSADEPFLTEVRGRPLVTLVDPA